MIEGYRGETHVGKEKEIGNINSLELALRDSIRKKVSFSIEAFVNSIVSQCRVIEFNPKGSELYDTPDSERLLLCCLILSTLPDRLTCGKGIDVAEYVKSIPNLIALIEQDQFESALIDLKYKLEGGVI